MAHTLLFVDDEPKIYQALRRALHRERTWKTIYAESAEAALEVLESESVDIVVADENMPGMNGTQLLSVVRQRWPDVIRMMLTGEARLDVVMKAVNCGEIYRFFTKPCNEAELIISIRDALQLRQLKEESRRLLDVVRKQSSELKVLRGSDVDLDGSDALPQAPPPAPAAPVRREESVPTLTLASSEATTGGVIQLGDTAEGDVDSLLADIRQQLDDLA